MSGDAVPPAQEPPGGPGPAEEPRPRVESSPRVGRPDDGFGPPGAPARYTPYPPTPAAPGPAGPAPQPYPPSLPGAGPQPYPAYPMAGPRPATMGPQLPAAALRRPPRRGPAEAWQPRPYQQLLRGPTLRWWRPLLSVAVLLGAAAAAFVVASLVAGAIAVFVSRGSGSGFTGSVDDAWLVSPVGLLFTNLILAALIPLTQLAVWGGFGWRPRWLASVTGGIRWGWLLRCYLLAAATLGLLTLALVLLSGGNSWHPEAQWLPLLVVVLLTTPLQAAGEEYLFRGWMQQCVGSVIANPVVGAVAGGVLSSTLFALAHGEQDPWLFADRFAFGVLASWLAWRTGGLEAGIALHGVNNLVAFGITIAQGGLVNTLTATNSSPISLLTDVVTLIVSVALLAWVARRAKLVRLFVPPLLVPAAAVAGNSEPAR